MLNFLVSLFPPTIHPMVVHFPIALLFTALLLDALAIWQKDLVLERAGLLVFLLGFLSLGVAALAGWVSEHYVTLTPVTGAILAAHRRDATLTGILFTLVAILRFRSRRLWIRQSPLKQVSLSSPHRVLTAATRRSWNATFIMYGLGLVMLSITGTVGGSLVYNHGLGVKGLGLRVPSANSGTHPSMPPSQSRAVAAGARLWTASCTKCHGTTPIFTARYVKQIGTATLIQFIHINMPPGHPVTTRQAQNVTAYFRSLAP